ncbi:excisionase [Bradyrhizobium sp. 192]|uniref:excisionase n=1 Tax=Bradyrhizobium sp. 192 TaxID=2782660 RepID=UPI001FFF19E0|nr:excisionase [Bradyrhizobium sp. 192]
MKAVTNHQDVSADDPLRLAVAAKIAFPDGSMTASGLRREAARGRLNIERIAGKDFTTLDDIKRMRELCRVQAKEPDCTNEKRDTAAENSFTRPSGSSRTEIAISAQDALRARLKQSRLQKQSKP